MVENDFYIAKMSLHVEAFINFKYVIFKKMASMVMMAALKVSVIDACSKDTDCTTPCDVQCKKNNKKIRFAQCIAGSCVCACQTL